jgi:hypothetical protein
VTATGQMVWRVVLIAGFEDIDREATHWLQMRMPDR